MNPEVIQFACGSCQHVLTVPAHLAGISGPCPVCGNTVTSPAPTASAPSSFAPPAFGPAAPAPGPAPMPAPVPSSPAPQASRPLGSGAGPVMPLPGAFPGSPSSQGGGFLPPAPPSQGFPSAAPASPAAPAWQSPGFGQTMLDSFPAASSAPQAPASTPPAQEAGGFLPPRRTEGQVPFAGNPGGGLLGGSPGGPPPIPQQPAWGSSPSPSFAAPEPAHPSLPTRPSGHGHSALIPGAPTLPMMGSSGGSSTGGNLLSRAIPSAPQASPSHESNSGLSLPSSSTASVSRSRPQNKPKRASNVFMIGLALLLLGGFLVAAGWLFREPIMQAVETVKAMIPGAAASAEVADAAPSSPSGENASPMAAKSPADEPAQGTVPDLADAAPAKLPGSFDPDEAPPQGLSAVLPPPATATASLDNPTILKAQPAMSASTPPTLDVPKGGLADLKTAVPDSKAKGGTSPLDAPAPPSGEMAAGSGVRLDDITKEAMPAAEALQKFLQAANLQERLEHTLASDVMRPIMERYYSSNPDGPITVDSIGLVRYDPKPQMGGGAHAVFGLESKTWEFPVPVMLEMTQGRFKVDWLSFVEFKDRLLEKFLAGYQEGPARFHVGITRTHYFEDKVPNVSNKDVFRVSPAPPNPFASVIFIEKDSDLGRELRDKIPWGTQVWAIVELEWMKLGSQNWVQLSAVPQLNWYSVPTAPKAQRATPGSPVADDAQVPTETQKAVPVGR